MLRELLIGRPFCLMVGAKAASRRQPLANVFAVPVYALVRVVDEIVDSSGIHRTAQCATVKKKVPLHLKQE